PSEDRLSASPLQAVPWWLDEAGPFSPAPPLEDELATDVCVVGGGFTGLWTALALKEREPSVRVVVLEAETCGAGPSGRNGGFLHGYWASLGETLPLLGRDRALELARAAERIIPAVRSLVEAQGEDVWLRESGLLMVSGAPAQDTAIEHAVEAAASVGASDQAVPLSQEEVAGRVRSATFRSGVFFPECATVQPMRLVKALRQAVLDSGIGLYEGSRALEIRDGEVTTANGRARASEIVVAINAAATGWRPVARHVTNFGSYVVLTEPVPHLLEEIGWTGGEAVVDGRMFLHYFRTTDDGRVLMGSGSGPIGYAGKLDARFSIDQPTAGRAEQGLRRLLPALADVRVERAWGGPIDVAADHLPFFGTVRGKRIHYGLGYSGHGVGPSWLGGQILASLALRIEDEWTALPLVTRKVPSLPPEPLKRLGGGLVRSAILACEHAEEQGRRAPLPARLGAALPRLLGMQIGTR
ncbi:MAG TPA: FAD-dependent oxidoreductase, partial [Gaiellaceae bacterium]